MTRWRAFAAGMVALLLAVAFFLRGPLQNRSEALFTRTNEFQQLTAYYGKHVVPRPGITSRTMVAFVFGQSNSANQNLQRFHASSDKVVNFWNGQYFRADDPLLGATGENGGFATLMADNLVTSGTFDGAIILAAGVGSTSVLEWTTGGRLNGMLEKRLAEAKAARLAVTHFLWHQGETDNYENHVAEYAAAMRPIIALTKRYFPNSKFFVARATICGTSQTRVPPNLELQAIQLSLTELPGVYAGPNSDDIGLEDRPDGCHFGASGQIKHADAWVEAITAHLD
jgi:hypothetical protein